MKHVYSVVDVGIAPFMMVDHMILMLDYFPTFYLNKRFHHQKGSSRVSDKRAQFAPIIIIIISSYSFNVRDPKTHTVFQASALARVGPPVIFLQAQRSCAISSFIPIAFMSLLTQLLHVFLGAPLSTTPITFILVHFFTQLFSSFRSTCPNHLNLPLCILFSTHSMPKRFKSSSLCFLSFKDTPHILLTIILSAPPQPSQVLRFYSPSLATIYQHSLYTGIIYFSLQFQRDTPFLSALALAH